MKTRKQDFLPRKCPCRNCFTGTGAAYAAIKILYALFLKKKTFFCKTEFVEYQIRFGPAMDAALAKKQIY